MDPFDDISKIFPNNLYYYFYIDLISVPDDIFFVTYYIVIFNIIPLETRNLFVYIYLLFIIIRMQKNGSLILKKTKVLGFATVLFA